MTTRSNQRNKRKKNGKPVVGITCEVKKQKPYFFEFDLYCNYRYIRAVIRAGAVPVLLPLNPFKRDVSNLVGHIDGLIIIGGADIPPGFYGEKTKKTVEPVYRGRTYFDLNLIRSAYRRRIPILAICYGMQLLNVYHGGTLHQDIASELKRARNHRSKHDPIHTVRVLSGTNCAKIFGKKLLHVHSSHHQAVKRLGRGLRIAAFSDDGIPEAIENPLGAIGVQWHPERTPKDPAQQRLFRHFIKLCKKK